MSSWSRCPTKPCHSRAIVPKPSCAWAFPFRAAAKKGFHAFHARAGARNTLQLCSPLTFPSCPPRNRPDDMDSSQIACNSDPPVKAQAQPRQFVKDRMQLVGDPGAVVSHGPQTCETRDEAGPHDRLQLRGLGSVATYPIQATGG